MQVTLSEAEKEAEPVEKRQWDITRVQMNFLGGDWDVRED